jgi:carbon storage regulator
MMLVLSRKSGEQVVIGDNIRITVVGVQGSRVTIGIEAPRDHQILRSELSERSDEPIIVEITIPNESAALNPAERSHPR